MVRLRRLLAASVGALALGFVIAPPALAADPTGPIGTLTVNDGSGYASNPTLTLHVAAQDSVALTTVAVYHDGTWDAPVPYADTIELALGAGTFDGEHQIEVTWTDADGNGATSDLVSVVLDRVAPALMPITLPDDPDPTDAVMPVGVAPSDGSALATVRFSSNGVSWSPPVPWAASVDWHDLDPALGGSAKLGSRTLYVEAADRAGNWSPPKTMPVLIAPNPHLTWLPEVPRTGHTITVTPNYPAPVTFSAGTYCMWEVAWGDPQSLYYGNRDETFGYFSVRGPASGGYCAPLSFTVPWMPYRRMLVHYEVELGGQSIGMGDGIGGSPDAPAIEPVVDSTSRSITSASMPLVYVLPQSSILIVGQPTTYHAYAVAGAKITSGDLWSVAYLDTPLQHLGGTSFTFTPDRPGNLTVCWGTDSTKQIRWSACFDPPARYRDHHAPVAALPITKIASGTTPLASIPALISWSAHDVGWGVKSYQVQRSVGGGAWHAWASTASRSRADTLVAGHSYRYRVRAIDKAGNVGAWVAGPTIHPVFVPDTAAAVVYHGAWTATPDASARNGELHATDAAAATATYRFAGRDVAWIADRGAGHGQTKVYVDGALVGTVDLAAAANDPARIVFHKHWAASGTHTVRIVVLGTVGRPTVDVDGFVVLR